MSLWRVQDPIYELHCDEPNCDQTFRSGWSEVEYYARRHAQEAGWQVRPNRGKGSRKGPDLCPTHAREATS